MHSSLNDRELDGIGLVRDRTGTLLDNRDQFYTERPDDHVRTYDCRTHLAISRGLLWKLLDAFVLAGGRL